MKKMIRLLPLLFYFSIAFSCASTSLPTTSFRTFETNQFAKSYLRTFKTLADDTNDSQPLISYMLKWTGPDNKKRFKKKLKLATDNLIDDLCNIILDYVFENITFDKKVVARLKRHVLPREYHFLSICAGAMHSNHSAWLLRYLIKDLGFNVNVKSSYYDKGITLVSGCSGINLSLASLKFILNETNFNPNQVHIKLLSVFMGTVWLVYTPLSRTFLAHKKHYVRFSELEKEIILYFMNHPKVKFELHRITEVKKTILDLIYECMQSRSEKTNLPGNAICVKEWGYLNKFWNVALKKGGRFKEHAGWFGNKPDKPTRPILHRQQQSLNLHNDGICLIL